MKKIFAVVMTLTICMLSQLAFAANIKDYPTVAVMNFGNKAVMSAGLRDTDFSAATEYAIYQLSACGWFDLVDYEQLSTIAKIHSVNMSGLVDPSTAVSVGKFVGAQFMIVGNLTGLTTKEGMLGIQAGNHGSIGGNKHTVIANVSMRIVDIETGRIVVAGLGKGESASTDMEIVFKKYRKPRTTNMTATSNSWNNLYGNLVYSPQNSAQVVRTGDGYQNGTSVDTEIPADISVPTEVGTTDTTATTYDGTSDVAIDNTTVYDGTTNTVSNDSYYDVEEYKITIGTVQVSDVQVRNAISKAVRDCIYGNMGLMTTLNGGKKLKIKTGF